MSKVRASADTIAQLAVDVRVDTEGCARTAGKIHELMRSLKYSPDKWSEHTLNPSHTIPGAVDWIFTVDTLNFSFWSDEPRFAVAYKGTTYTGYWSLVAAINRALDEGLPITDPTFWVSKDFTPALVSHIFRSDTEAGVPLLEERFTVLRDAGRTLENHGFRSFEDLLKRNEQKSALFVVDWVANNIASYNDVAVYRGHPVCFYKRAQILVGDIWACFKGDGPGEFKDINEITMFADYRVPQILYANGCLTYSPRLLKAIQSKKMLLPGSPEEIEIRGCSIWAVELIVERLRQMREPSEQENTNAVLVDFYLWDTAKQNEKENTDIVECHRVRSVYY